VRAAGGGEDQAQGVGPGVLPGARLPDAGREHVGEGVALGGAAGVDRAAPLAALGCLDVQRAADLDDLAVHGHDAGGLVDLGDGQGGYLAPPQPGVGGEAGHQLRLACEGGEGLAELGHISMRGDLAGVNEQRGLPGDADGWLGCRAVPGLPVHEPKPGAGQVPAGDARPHQRGDAPPHPGAFPGRRRGVHHGLHVRGLDVLTRQAGDHRSHIPLAQPALGIGVLTRPWPARRMPPRRQVVGDQVRAGAFQARRVGCQPHADLLQLRGQPRLRHRLTEPPPPILGPHRPPRLPRHPRRVHRDPPAHLNHHTIRTTDGLAGVAANAGRPARLPPPGGAPGGPVAGRLCCFSVDPGLRGRYRRHGVPSLPAVCAGERASRCSEIGWSGAGSNRRPSAFQAGQSPCSRKTSQRGRCLPGAHGRQWLPSLSSRLSSVPHMDPTDDGQAPARTEPSARRSEAMAAPVRIRS
jgi:hypothetical protein